MVVDVVVPQRLLDHQQVELVEFPEMLDFVQGISGVGVTTEYDVRPARTNTFQHLQVPARFHLHLDATIAGRELSLNLVEKLVDRILNADRNTARDFALRAAQQLPQRLLPLPGFRIPERVFNRGLGHAMTSNSGHQRRRLGGGRKGPSQQRGGEVVLDGWPGGFQPFRTVIGIFAGHTFPPTVNPVTMRSDEKNASAVGAAKAGLEEMHERHLKFAERDGFKFHKHEPTTDTEELYFGSGSQRPSRNFPFPCWSRLYPSTANPPEKASRNSSRLRSWISCARLRVSGWDFHS